MIILYISFVSAALTLFLNYCMGKPGSEKFSEHEVFSFYTIWLSKRRLKAIGLFEQYNDQYRENFKRLDSYHAKLSLRNDFKKVLYDAADPFFTWERAAGMCPVCFGFWVSLFNGLVYYNFMLSAEFPFLRIVVHLLAVIVFSHIIIRVLNKFI